jgi:flavin reductase (DIM6/NTAB) family NADH-FMN oxidoreductase RutF
MKKTDIPFQKAAERTIELLQNPGCLVTCCDADGRPNAMAIGWGLVGTVWGRPIFEILVRPSRYTYELIEATGDFTVNVPAAGLKKAVMYCGAKSGRDEDKLAACGLVAKPSREVTSPILADCAVHFECRVVHATDMVPPHLDGEIEDAFYGGADYHRCYHGLIVACYGDPDVV